MAKKDTYKLVVDYHHNVKSLYEKADALEDAILIANKEALDSDAFSRNFENKSSDEYSDFEREVLKLINRASNAVVDSDVSSSYKQVLESYKAVLSELSKD